MKKGAGSFVCGRPRSSSCISICRGGDPFPCSGMTRGGMSCEWRRPGPAKSMPSACRTVQWSPTRRRGRRQGRSEERRVGKEGEAGQEQDREEDKDGRQGRGVEEQRNHGRRLEAERGVRTQ